jgi:hypothetical protein
MVTVMNTKIALDDQAREALRGQHVAATPRWYSPWLHAASSFGLAATLAVLGMLAVRDLAAWELGMVVPFYSFCNAVEWKAHKSLLHRRVRFLEMFHDTQPPWSSLKPLDEIERGRERQRGGDAQRCAAGRVGRGRHREEERCRASARELCEFL